MTDLTAIFRSGFTRRWHTNPDLAHTQDRVDGHSARVARLLLALHPSPSAALLRAALIHDDGESVTGDLPGPFKARLPIEARSALDVADVEATWKLWGFGGTSLGAQDALWLHFCDRLDAYQWALHHAPDLRYRDDWIEFAAWLLTSSRNLGCYQPVSKAIAPLALGASAQKGAA